MDNRQKKVIKSSVTSSVVKLIKRAQAGYRKNQFARSKRYVEMAFDLIKKHKVTLPSELKNSFCKKCHALWFPGETLIITYDKKNHCLRIKCNCGYSKRI
ncbi:hypothetical protein KKF81_02975 [Candidatus Micrarchaeota archaeon]|nr:hypothetical protein [Candidatus Micrarchaeota archaeon]MBU1165885.1 hypothetical protein [Candidatus Micrarchaeota archaeon]MBU1886993.1 hypothetical protein [Candidatus Micrarchaeota archaeon]